MVSERFDFYFYDNPVKSGTKLQFKNDREVYRFRSLVCDSVFNEEWLEVIDSAGNLKRFHPSKIKNIVVKKSQKGIIRESELID